jgi:hypothetical protein
MSELKLKNLIVSDLVIWAFTRIALPEIGIQQPRDHRVLGQVTAFVSGGVDKPDLVRVRLIQGGKSVVVRRSVLDTPRPLEIVGMAVKARSEGAPQTATQFARRASKASRGVV